uniref:Uncharacterized protein n=1 Tax=Anopheles epiroticus TaxID=199890 RepID=A0A182P6L1_9DIPT
MTFCKTIPLTPPEILIENTDVELSSDGNEMMQCGNSTRDMLFNLGEEDDHGVLFSSTNPLIGGQGLLNDSLARPLTIQTDQTTARGSIHAPGTNGVASDRFRGGKLFGSASTTSTNGPSTMDEFSMIVSPSLLTPTDMEIWRAIQQGQLDPKKLPSGYGTNGGAAGGHIPKSLSSTPTAQLLSSADLLGGDCSSTNLLADLDNDFDDALPPYHDTLGSNGRNVSEDGAGLLQHGMLI